MSENILTSYPEGMMKAAESLTFLPEEARMDFIVGFMLAAMMETA